MTTDTEMKLDYVMVLKNLQADLEGMEGRRKALLATIAGLTALISEGEQHQLDLIGKHTNGSVPTPVPPGFFTGKTPTQAYRDLTTLWPAERTPPQIATALLAGGMTVKSRTELLQAIHSVLKRERERQQKEATATP